jgi:hypothetical protein
MGDVADDDVGVQQRVARARRAVTERGGDEPSTAHGDSAAMVAPHSARLALEIGHRFHDRGLVRPDDLSRHIGLRDAEEDAHALRRLEGQVEAGDRALRQRRAQRTAPRCKSVLLGCAGCGEEGLVR